MEIEHMPRAAPGGRAGAWATVLLLAALLTACGGGGSGGDPGGPTEGPLGCAALAGAEVAAADIGLSTRGATVTSARAVAAAEADNGNGDHCRLEGRIRPVDVTAPDIRFQLNLPVQWNGKALQMGGSGYGGTVVTGTGQIDMAPYFTPLSRGYATFGSDTGHAATAIGADFALDAEALRNYGGEHIKKTRDVAMRLLQRHYGQAPAQTYFAGASTGGREAFTAIQRFPQDYDGIVAIAPSLNFAGVRLMGLRIGQASYRTPGGFLPPAKQRRLLQASLDACDALDGAQDGIVGDVAGCRARSEATLAALRCAGGADTGDDCLSDAQAATVRLIHEGFTLPYELAHGQRGYDGYNILEGADFSGPLGLGSSPTLQTPPSFGANGYLFTQGDAYLKYFVARDPGFDSLAFDLADQGPLQPRLVEVSGLVGAMDPDLSAFEARGGKVILMHGLADEVISPNQTIGYYLWQVQTRGQAAVDGFLRFYTVPGFGHGGGVFVPFWDPLGALDRWVSEGAAPQTLEATDIVGATQGRKRPMCRYPAYPQYRGGDASLEEASSFECVRP